MDTSLSTAKRDGSYTNRKRVVLAGLAAIIILCVVWLAMPFSIARTLSDPDDESEWSKFHTTYYSYETMVSNELSDGMFLSVDAIFGDDATTAADGNIVNRSLANVKTNIESSVLYSNVGTALEGIAMFVVVVYSLFRMFEELQRGDGSMDMWTKTLVTLGIGLFVVMNWSEILDVLEQLGQYLVDKVGDAVTTTDHLDKLKTWFEDTFAWGSEDFDMKDIESIGAFHVGKILGAVGDGVLLYICSFFKMIGMTAVLVIFEIPLMAGRIVLLTILIELQVRKAFFPLAIADVAGNGARSPGVGYMKKFVALYIRIGMCYLIAATGNIIVNACIGTDVNNFLEGMLRVVCIFIAYMTCTKLYSATSSISSQVVGV